MSERKDRKQKRKQSWWERLFGKKQVVVVPLGTITVTRVKHTRDEGECYGRSPEDIVVGKRTNYHDPDKDKC